MQQNILENITSPEDLRQLNSAQLKLCCAQLREYIIEVLSKNPGHLGSSLGAVELAVALHYAFNTPEDKIVWDVGHQAYAHKILTARREQFAKNRQRDGLSGFPKPSESPYDSYVAGHASVSISAALGMAVAARQSGKNQSVVAVIGDGAMTGGLSFEGLNNAGASGCDILVVLNDNNMAIDANTGALKKSLLRLTVSEHYNKLKIRLWNFFGGVPRFRRLMQNVLNAIKSSIFQQSNIFESLNFRYFGPVDGHDLDTLIKLFKDLQQIKGPKLLHIVTKKGKGYAPAEADPAAWHAPGTFDVATGERDEHKAKNESRPPRYQDVFGETLLELARENDKIIGITAAMPTGCSLNIMAEKMPNRVFDVGIAEGHAVSFAAGAASSGLVPFCAIYSTFVQRAYDNIIHDVALQNLNVVLCLDRAGVVGEDGATHHGVFDIPSLRTVPNLIIAAPMDEPQLRDMIYTASKGIGPVVIRYPRGRGVTIDWRKPFSTIEVGQSRVISSGEDVALLTIGNVGNFALAASVKALAQGVSVEHIDMRFVKPLDEARLHDIASRFSRVITVEDGAISGGFGSAVLEFFQTHGYSLRVTRLGVPDRFIDHGSVAEQYSECGYDEHGILSALMGE